MVDMKHLSDCELHSQLEKLGFSPGPVLPSTRKVYEKKLQQLLASIPCASSVTDGPTKPGESHDSDDSQELSIILKGNITLSAEKSKELQKNPVCEKQDQQEDDSECNNFKVIIKRPEAPAGKTTARDGGCLVHKLPKGIRYAARPSDTRVPRCKAGCVVRKRCAADPSAGLGLPLGLKLAVLGIFIIVLFVYITVEKKPIFG
ncbi:LEM domain-containing protein 1 isoform X1 [Ochotona princeps]|uniref:LEM domain-containing protein 1 isoform X1 n=1 Tax=Ochotona princeps TaxID=9978 RepID=UPI002714F24D|nr:LEM domain-containing protein 1 isoform X1 [Ochotona princeps]